MKAISTRQKVNLVGAAVIFTLASTLNKSDELVVLFILLIGGAFNLWLGLGFLQKTDEILDSNDQKIS